MFEGVHDEDGEAQSEDVGQEAGVEIGPAVLLQAAGGQEILRLSSGRRGGVEEEAEGGVT